jgi:hypothetical protein
MQLQIIRNSKFAEGGRFGIDGSARRATPRDKTGVDQEILGFLPAFDAFDQEPVACRASGAVLIVGDRLEPVDDLAVLDLVQRDMRHRGVG